MRRQPYGLYAIALAILVVGLVALGVPASTLLFAVAVLACPLMMIFMHGGHGGGHDRGRTGHAAPGQPLQRPDVQPGGHEHEQGRPAGRARSYRSQP
jgi:hypothetical protein